MIADIDKDDSGTIDFQEFVDMMTGKMSERDSKEEIQKVFALFDHEGAGKISFRDLKRVVTELGESISDEEMREMIEEADKDGDGYVVFDDFFKMMKKKSDNPLDDMDDDDDGECAPGAGPRRWLWAECPRRTPDWLAHPSNPVRFSASRTCANPQPAPPSPQFKSARAWGHALRASSAGAAPRPLGAAAPGGPSSSVLRPSEFQTLPTSDAIPESFFPLS